MYACRQKVKRSSGYSQREPDRSSFWYDTPPRAQHDTTRKLDKRET